MAIAHRDALGQTIFLTGPPGAGKTRTALLWPAHRRRPTFAIDSDHIRSTLELGDVVAGRAPLGVEQQYQRAAKVAAAQAAHVNNSGVDCIVVGARAPAPPPAWARAWDDLDHLNPITIVLLPSEEVCLARNAADASRMGAFAVPAEHVKASFAAFGWEQWRERPRSAVIDTSDLTQLEVIEAAEHAVEQLSR